MIANFFNQTKPINFLVMTILVTVVFLSAVVRGFEGDLSLFFFVKNGIFLFAAILTVFVLNFIIRKNGLCEDNSYAILFYILFWGIFPESLLNGGIFASNFILLFAFRRLYSLRSALRIKEKIFDSFFRSPEASRQFPKGVGLGLKILKHIMEAHNGKIKVRSQPGQGSVFILIFPRS